MSWNLIGGGLLPVFTEKLAQLNAQVIISRGLREPAVLQDLLCARIFKGWIVAAQDLRIKVPGFPGIDYIRGVVIEAGLFSQAVDVCGRGG
jgi:hypothetical protein